MKAAHISNRPAKLDKAKLKTAAMEHTRLDLRNRFESLQLVEDASPEDEWRELKDAVADASQAHLGKTRRRRHDWVTGETIALAKQARLARIQNVSHSPAGVVEFGFSFGCCFDSCLVGQPNMMR